jgi:hypothetical protein
MKQYSNANAADNGPGSSIELKPRSLKELSALYGISSRTLKKWLKPFEKEVGKRIGYYYSITQVKKIFRFLGFPGMFYEEGEDALL